MCVCREGLAQLRRREEALVACVAQLLRALLAQPQLLPRRATDSGVTDGGADGAEGDMRVMDALEWLDRRVRVRAGATFALDLPPTAQGGSSGGRTDRAIVWQAPVVVAEHSAAEEGEAPAAVEDAPVLRFVRREPVRRPIGPSGTRFVFQAARAGHASVRLACQDMQASTAAPAASTATLSVAVSVRAGTGGASEGQEAGEAVALSPAMQALLLVCEGQVTVRGACGRRRCWARSHASAAVAMLHRPDSLISTSAATHREAIRRPTLQQLLHHPLVADSPAVAGQDALQEFDRLQPLLSGAMRGME